MKVTTAVNLIGEVLTFKVKEMMATVILYAKGIRLGEFVRFSSGYEHYVDSMFTDKWENLTSADKGAIINIPLSDRVSPGELIYEVVNT